MPDGTPSRIVHPKATNWEAPMSYTIEVNGVKHTVDAEGDTPLLWILRDALDLTGTKYGCGVGLCGACTVHSNGAAVRSCMLPLASVGRSRITTIEGIGASEIGGKVQQRWLAADVPQCGYCQGGQIMSATALLTRIAKPGDADIDSAMSGNLCRCGCYARIRAAIRHIADSPAA
jgi:isoquinoline 1-oxidoreductase subunit alpha